MVVQTLRHEVHGQRVLTARGLLDLGALVLEPNLDLRLVEAELLRQALAPLLGQVPVGLELGLEPLQLLGREGRAGPLVFFVGVLLLWFARPGTWAGTGTEHRVRRAPGLSADSGHRDPGRKCPVRLHTGD